MPGYVLHLGAVAFCSHAGQAQPTATSPRLTVLGMPVATMPAPWTIAGCTLAASGSTPPCVTAQWTTAATRVTSLGQALLVSLGAATCLPTGTPLQVASSQTRVTAL